MKEYNHSKIEKKWQNVWEKKKIYKTLDSSKKPKYYVLDMFPYPSGEGLHVGHPKGYIATDIISRMKRMQGMNVLHPMGFDAFGLPAENYALKMKMNPAISVSQNVARFKKQLEIIGLDYDWSREINTTDPKFYKWTEWIFLKLLENGLAYESYEPINWCPSCKTGLANEDLEDGKCERCGSEIEQKPMRQWVLRITDYAERLLKDLDLLDWPESIKESQRNWIGKSEGSEIEFKIKNHSEKIKVFTTRADTIFGATYVVLAPEHPIINNYKLLITNWEEVEQYIKEVKNKTNIERTALDKNKTGIELKGVKAINPANNEEIPVWIADYVLATYGTGAIMAVPQHDIRDNDFAVKYYLPIIDRPLVDAIEITNKVGGKIVTKYKLRDWVFSRQRYWGEPIPVLHDGDKIIPVDEKDLPVILPKVKSYEPTGTGESPLAGIDNWVNVKISKGKNAKIIKRETNTMPQWAGSSWYYLRYMDPNNNKALVDKKKEKYWNQIDFYVGGAEHATRHLIYARFWHKFLYDIGAISTKEPFKKLQSVGLIIGEDGRKMSKRFGNVVNPDDIVKIYGADTLRIYEMFMGPFNQTVVWNTNSIIGSRRFLERVWRLGNKVGFSRTVLGHLKGPSFSRQVESNSNQSFSALLHKTIKKVSEDIESMNFNTAISSMMILVNEMEKVESISIKDFKIFLQILAPFAPHITEEIWQNLRTVLKRVSPRTVLENSIHLSEWPKWDEKKIIEEEIKIAIQVNGKVRAEIMISKDMTEEDIKDLALKNKDINIWIENKEIKRVIYVPGRIINIVI